VKGKIQWDTDKDGLTRINKNTIWLAFGDKEHIAGQGYHLCTSRRFSAAGGLKFCVVL
jgi:hypothetical protein